jgi:predicted TIM-barrel fold metal-dependent hydrolase
MKINSKISRREFNSKLTKSSLGLATIGVFSSCGQTEKSAPVAGKFIDIHHHLGNNFITDTGQITLEPILNWMDDHDVSRMALLSILYRSDLFPWKNGNAISNDELLEKIAETKGRILPFCVLDQDAFSTTEEIVKVLKGYKDKGVTGFGELKPMDKMREAKNLAINDPAMKRIYAACGEVDFPVTIHIDNKHAVDVPGLPGLEDILKEFPQVNFLAHANGWWNSISGDVSTFKGYPKEPITPDGAVLRLLKDYPNLYGDLSANSGLNAVTRDPEVGLKFLNDYSDKLLFGTDALGNKGGEGHFDFYNQLDLPLSVKNKIFKENARSLLKLTD